MTVLRRLLLGLWAGLLLAQSGLYAPLLFEMLPDHALAGRVAGAGFRIVAYASLLFGLAVVACRSRTVTGQRRQALWALAPGLLMIISDLTLTPLMDSSRAGGPLGSHGPDFALWHGLASALYLVAGALVAALWVREERRAGG